MQIAVDITTCAQWGQTYADMGLTEEEVRLRVVSSGGYGRTTLRRVLRAYREQLRRI